MANDISSNPWRLDTPTDTPLATWEIKIDNIVWADTAGATASSMTITQANGKVIIDATAPASETTQGVSYGKVGWVKGLTFPLTTPPGTHGNTLNGSIVFVYIGSGK